MNPVPPGPKRLPSLIYLYRLGHDMLAFLDELASYGEISYVETGKQNIYLLSNADAVREVLVVQEENFQKAGNGVNALRRLFGDGLLTSTGGFHSQQRKMIQPGFQPTRFDAYGKVMTHHSCEFSEGLGDGEEIDVADEMQQLTLGIVGEALFGTSFHAVARDIQEAVSVVLDSYRYAMLPFIDVIAKLPIPAANRYKHALKRLDEIVYGLIRECRRRGTDGGDLLSRIVLGAPSDDTMVRNEIMTLMIAGHETTANALTWTLYLLSQHPECEKAFHAEIDSTLGDRVATVEDLPLLKYTHAVLAESMRMYPPIYVLATRKCVRDTEISGFVIPKDSYVLLSPYISHKNPRYFPHPERFDPSRWLGDPKAIPRFAYFPFSRGDYGCLGEQFAWMEGKLVLATLGAAWRFQRESTEAVKAKAAIVLRPEGGLKMRVIDRRNYARRLGTRYRSPGHSMNPGPSNSIG